MSDSEVQSEGQYLIDELGCRDGDAEGDMSVNAIDGLLKADYGS
jgi:hypothetical protein